MNDVKLSLVIPYKGRLANLRTVFEALAHQTMDGSEFEVLVGAMEYSEEYVGACREFTGRLNIVSVLSAAEFEIPRARNLGMRQATGEVVVQMDADTLLAPGALQNLYDRHFSFGQDVCVVGQVVGYGNNDRDVTSVDVRPYAHYRAALEELGRAGGAGGDPRFLVPHVVPWAFAWTGLIALRLATVRANGLYFDESFHGWGVDDLEWGYRICATHTPIVLRPDVYALHLPHLRDRAANERTERANYRRFLRKWPAPDVELAHAFGDVAANARFLGYLEELRKVTGGPPGSLGVARGRACGRDLLLVGVLTGAEGRVGDPGPFAMFDGASPAEVWPLAGLALPYEDGEVAECRILPPVSGFSAPYRKAIRAEAERVAGTVVLPEGGGW
ncbi:glycosyltransferase family 2 protein [Streptomyces hoynatensis]|uniref:Glycosyltransferase n=1 Tax=Streptomyces hoynatensis TaxID=1141874 RepID=A0A3A9Z9C4_9ACTN|nr:glycosyltransferase family 2 protein [Streptomyces hoynatensis]RKN44910.1 glycosyltransferase [Streptomyces hoynatensis]